MRCRLIAISLAAMLPAAAAAEPFDLIYEGSFSAAETLIAEGGGADLITGTTPFRVVARFDTTSPDLSIPPLPGWASFAPIEASITIGGTRYSIVGHGEDPLSGVTVNVFDRTNVFVPGLYGVGLFVNPIQDGAGFVADFSAADPEFLVTDLTATVFQGYNGAGYLAGVGCLPPGAPACVAQPWSLRDAGGDTFGLGFARRTEEFVEGAPLARVRIVGIPEPGTLASFGLGAVALGGGWHRRRSRART